MLNRRHVVGLAAVGAAAEAAGLVPTSAALTAPSGAGVRAVAFDAFPIFDPRPVFALAEQLFPGRGAALSATWRTRQFEYQWLRALSGRYADFWQTTEDALVYSSKLLKLDLTADKRDQLMGAYLRLNVWPDVLPALRALMSADVRLGLLSNATAQILEQGIANAGLDYLFDRVLSTDVIKTFKPDPRAYRLAMDAWGLAREQILFVPFAGWDASGAKGFGYTTYWVNRLDAPVEELGVQPDVVAQSLAELPRYVRDLHRAPR